MERLARSSEALPLTTRSVVYISVNDSKHYSWDKDFGHTCICDSSWPVGLLSGETQLAEYFGPSCEFHRCPSGDDPTTAVNETDCAGISQTGRMISLREKGKAGNLCHIDCSNHGLCNFETGLCSCFSGWMGDNCGKRIP
jgi:hypothetical protein